MLVPFRAGAPVWLVVAAAAVACLEHEWADGALDQSLLAQGPLWLLQKIRNVVRGLRQKWSSAEAKGRLWDGEYSSGRWDHCEFTPEDQIYEYVYRYCNNGSVLDVGCGSGNTGNELDASRYSDYTGIDVSDIAIKKAAARSAANGRTHKNCYQQGDLLRFVPSHKYDVILFRESIYYVTRSAIKGVLNRYAGYLTEQGVLIVYVGGVQARKASRILKIIETNFEIVGRGPTERPGQFLVVFKPPR